jgi:hypothetical protein
MTTQVNEVEKERHFQMMFQEFCEALARVAFKVHTFPDIEKEVLFKEAPEQNEAPLLMRNRGSSIDSSSDDSGKDQPKPRDDLAEFYYSKHKPLHVKLEILIRILQLCIIEGNDITKLREDIS